MNMPGIKCKNYIVCQSLRFGDSCLCANCDMSGIFIVDDECQLCFELLKCVLHPDCRNTLCIRCFKKCYMHDEYALRLSVT
jgi:hypothetical protein